MGGCAGAVPVCGVAVFAGACAGLAGGGCGFESLLVRGGAPTADIHGWNRGSTKSCSNAFESDWWDWSTSASSFGLESCAPPPVPGSVTLGAPCGPPVGIGVGPEGPVGSREFFRTMVTTSCCTPLDT